MANDTDIAVVVAYMIYFFIKEYLLDTIMPQRCSMTGWTGVESLHDTAQGPLLSGIFECRLQVLTNSFPIYVPNLK
jgi:hypothetical protein